MKKRGTAGLRPAVTTKDIAERTGLSKMTISRVLNGHPYVSDETRQKVMGAVRELGFRPNTLAKRFFTGKTRLIGVVIPLEYMFSSFYFAELFQGILEYTEEKNYDVLLHNSKSAKKLPLEKCLDLVKGKLAEGLLIAAPMTYDTYPLKLAQEGVPLVMVGQSPVAEKVNRVVIANQAAAADAVRRLLALGHRKIAVLTYDADHAESQERLAGCRQAMKEAGAAFDESLVLRAHYSRKEAFAETQRILKARPDVTAILALNADMAMGAVAALRGLRLKIPDDVSVVSFDDSVEMEEHEPPIAAVRQFPARMGRAAAEMLIDLLAPAAKPRKPQCKVIETQFVERRSVAIASARKGNA